MRRQFFINCLLLCALMLSGWGGVLAAALCPHAASVANAVHESMKMDDDHACCRMKMESAGEHCSNQSHQLEPQALAPPVESSCPHCISRGGLPPAPAKGSEPAQHSSDANRLTARAATHVAPPAVNFVCAVSPTQGAPPGLLIRKHLLLSIFLI